MSEQDSENGKERGWIAGGTRPSLYRSPWRKSDSNTHVNKEMGSDQRKEAIGDARNAAIHIISRKGGRTVREKRGEHNWPTGGKKGKAMQAQHQGTRTDQTYGVNPPAGREEKHNGGGGRKIPAKGGRA